MLTAISFISQWCLPTRPIWQNTQRKCLQGQCALPELPLVREIGPVCHLLLCFLSCLWRKKKNNSTFISLLKADFGRQKTWHCIFVLLLKRTLNSLKMVAFSFLIILLLMALLKTFHQSHCCCWSSPGCFLGSPGCQSAKAQTSGPAYARNFPASGREQGMCIHTPIANRQTVFEL